MICLSFDYRIFLLVLVLLIPTWFAYRYLATRQDALKLNRQKLIGLVTEDTIEFIKGLPVLKSYNMTEKQFSKMEFLVGESQTEYVDNDERLLEL